MTQTTDHIAGRVRAARAYAGITTQKTLGDQIGLSRDSVIAIESDKREPTLSELRKIARATGVPFHFLLDGWDGIPSLEERVAALEEAVRQAERDRDAQAAELDSIRETLRTQFAEVASRRLAQDHAPNTAADRRSGGDRRAP